MSTQRAVKMRSNDELRRSARGVWPKTPFFPQPPVNLTYSFPSSHHPILPLLRSRSIQIQAKTSSDERPEYLRPNWLLGITSYVLSQVIGSTLALQYLRSEFVAPLGASSLIFNFLFAKWLIGTPIGRRDLQGTLLIVLGVLAILIFASINSGLSTSLSLVRLQHLSVRAPYVLYLLLQTAILILAWLSLISLSQIYDTRSSLLATTATFPPTSPPRPPTWLPKSFLNSIFPRTHRAYHVLALIPLQTKISQLTERTSDERLLFLLGVGWASVGGALAGGSLVFAKSMVMVGMDDKAKESGWVYAHWVTAWTGLLLVACAVSQMVALNRGLKFYDSTLVVPVFYAGYTLLGFLNTMIFLDQFAAYSYTILFFLLLSIALLLSGVVLLSTKKEEPSPDAPLPSSNDPGRRDDGEDDHDAHHGGARREADGGEEATERRRAERERLRVEGGEEGRALFDAAEDEGGQFELGGSSDSEEDDRSSDKEEEKRRIEKGKVAEPLDDDEVFGAWTDAGGGGSTGVAVSRGSRDEVLGGVR